MTPSCLAMGGFFCRGVDCWLVCCRLLLEPGRGAPLQKQGDKMAASSHRLIFRVERSFSAIPRIFVAFVCNFIYISLFMLLLRNSIPNGCATVPRDTVESFLREHSLLVPVVLSSNSVLVHRFTCPVILYQTIASRRFQKQRYLSPKKGDIMAASSHRLIFSGRGW